METLGLEILKLTEKQIRTIPQGRVAFEEAIGFKMADGLFEFLPPDPERMIALSAPGWTSAFFVVCKSENICMGMCGFKGPPDKDGIVEIAYGIAPSYENRGFATEIARRMTRIAFDRGVAVVRAHTLPEPNASGRVLTKAGFRKLGEVIDPEDGLVWRWEFAG
jgi:ribosomal-protein-alanine N-acetyltransferase